MSRKPPKTHIARKFCLGPGIITGAADDDPSGIATYTQTGAQFGFSQLWTVILMLPMMIAVQEACARIGAVTGQGICKTVKQYYPRWILLSIVGLVLIANTINIGADIGAMAASTQLLLPIPFPLLVIGFTTLILVLQVFMSYHAYAKILKWLSFTLLAYILTMLIVKQDWSSLLHFTLVPHIELSTNFLFLITGVFGTTISPYMFFWQANEVVEEKREQGLNRKAKASLNFQNFLWNLRLDNLIGMLASQFTTWCIIVVAASVLFRHGVTDVKTAADAAQALLPLVQTFPYAGMIAKSIFAIGVIGLGLLAIPILSGSASYALCEALGWKEGLNLKPHQGKGFYSIIIISTVVGLLMNFIGINPVKALIYTAVINGVIAVPLVFLILRISNNTKIMGKYTTSNIGRVMLWLTFLAMSASAIALFFSLLHGAS